MDIRFEDVFTQGITQLDPVDIQYAREMGYTIKLLGIAKRSGEGAPAEVRVHPTLIPSDSPLGKVNGVFNGILVDGRPIGTTMYYGRGAGADPTSSAVISDLMALAADDAGFSRWRDSRLCVQPGVKQIKPMDELETHYYIRFTMADRPGAMATIGRALADQGGVDPLDDPAPERRGGRAAGDDLDRDPPGARAGDPGGHRPDRRRRDERRAGVRT